MIRDFREVNMTSTIIYKYHAIEKCQVIFVLPFDFLLTLQKNHGLSSVSLYGMQSMLQYIELQDHR